VTREAIADLVVDVPVEVVFRAWRDFEHYPRFMAHVKRVRQTDASGRTLHWVSKARTAPHEWDAEVTDLTINQRVAWRSLSGKANDGTVLLEPQGEQTRVTLRWIYEPAAGGDGHDASAVTDEMTQAVHEHLVNFKRLVETGQPPRASHAALWIGASGATAALLASVAFGIWYARTRRQPLPRRPAHLAQAMRAALRSRSRPARPAGWRSLNGTTTRWPRALAR
jgi:uncharacterized protein YndB with AHSA1/START domain